MNSSIPVPVLRGSSTMLITCSLINSEFPIYDVSTIDPPIKRMEKKGGVLRVLSEGLEGRASVGNGRFIMLLVLVC